MMILRFWERIILGPWSRTSRTAGKPAYLPGGVRLQALMLAVMLAAALPAASLEQLTRAYRAKPTAGNRNALENFARANARAGDGPLADLALGQIDLELGRETTGITSFEEARKRLPKLADHIDYGIARCLIALGKKPEAIETLKQVIAYKPVSPQRPWAILLAARTYLDIDNPQGAIDLLRTNIDDVPQPQGTFYYGSALMRAGASAAAAVQLQKVYYNYPTSEEAKRAESLLTDIMDDMGGAYPPVMPQAMIGRATLLMRGGDRSQAIRELEAMIPDLGGAERDLAQVRIGVARYLANENAPAMRYLSGLNVSSPEADAERLYYMFACARRLGKIDDDGEAARRQLDEKYPDSPWRLETLVSYGNDYLVKNDALHYEPLYQACADGFPHDERAAYCHWKVAWAHYLRRDSDAPALLREHLERFPDSEKASAALYFLGRDAESRKDFAAAHAFYRAILDRYPNFFYAVPARERLADRSIASAGASPATQALIDKIHAPTPRQDVDFHIDAATRLRIERARLLLGATLDDLAVAELRFAANTDAKSGPLAVELAQTMSRRGEAARGIRYIKSLSPGYLAWNLDEAPRDFWQLAFPLPYRDSLEEHSRSQNLDALMMAALIRQESEFDPRAVSRAKAVGLTQITPSTGREISRQLKIRYRSSLLYQPDSNLRMGTYYLRTLLDRVDGRWEAALAAYNAGMSRAVDWLQWGDFREPAEFIETIPFTETRNYVQTVIRNADVYRRLYGTRAAAVKSSGGSSSSQTIRSTEASYRLTGALP